MEELTLNRSDLLNIGEYVFEEDGYCSFVCNPITAKNDELLLRKILMVFGKQYTITSDEPFVWDDENGDDALYVRYNTNLPVGYYLSEVAKNK